MQIPTTEIEGVTIDEKGFRRLKEEKPFRTFDIPWDSLIQLNTDWEVIRARHWDREGKLRRVDVGRKKNLLHPLSEAWQTYFLPEIQSTGRLEGRFFLENPMGLGSLILIASVLSGLITCSLYFTVKLLCLELGVWTVLPLLLFLFGTVVLALFGLWSSIKLYFFNNRWKEGAWRIDREGLSIREYSGSSWHRVPLDWRTLKYRRAEAPPLRYFSRNRPAQVLLLGIAELKNAAPQPSTYLRNAAIRLIVFWAPLGAVFSLLWLRREAPLEPFPLSKMITFLFGFPLLSAGLLFFLSWYEGRDFPRQRNEARRLLEKLGWTK